jgi:hypothetical protein
MLKDTEIPAYGDVAGLLTLTALMALRNLVFRSETYAENSGFYGDLWATLKQARVDALADAIDGETEEEAEERKAVGQVLAGVVKKLRRTPSIRVEDEGSRDAQSFFRRLTTGRNWPATLSTPSIAPPARPGHKASSWRSLGPLSVISAIAGPIMTSYTMWSRGSDAGATHRGQDRDCRHPPRH